MLENTNPKALNLEDIDFNGSKLTIGFKCLPEKKYTLALEAEALGITLSQHVENQLMNLDRQKERYEKKINELEERIAFYENDTLTSFYNAYKLQNIKYVTSDGEAVELLINDIKDVYTVIINSFKEK